MTSKQVELDPEALERAARAHRGNNLLPSWELLPASARLEWRESARRVIEAYLEAHK